MGGVQIISVSECSFNLLKRQGAYRGTVSIQVFMPVELALRNTAAVSL